MCHQYQELHRLAAWVEPGEFSLLLLSFSLLYSLQYINSSIVFQLPRLWSILPTKKLSTLISLTWRTSSALCSSHAMQPNIICSAVSSCESQCKQRKSGSLFILYGNEFWSTHDTNSRYSKKFQAHSRCLGVYKKCTLLIQNNIILVIQNSTCTAHE